MYLTYNRSVSVVGFQEELFLYPGEVYNIRVTKKKQVQLFFTEPNVFLYTIKKTLCHT